MDYQADLLSRLTRFGGGEENRVAVDSAECVHDGRGGPRGGERVEAEGGGVDGRWVIGDGRRTEEWKSVYRKVCFASFVWLRVRPKCTMTLRRGDYHKLRTSLN